MSKYIDIEDWFQGRDTNNAKFGYVGIEGRGGYFFTHDPASLQNTLDSLEKDEIDEPKNWPERARQEARVFIRREWRKHYGQNLDR